MNALSTAVRRPSFRLMLGAAAVAVALTGAAVAQSRSADALRDTGQVGEQADGFMACVQTCDAQIQAAVRAVNERRAAEYRRLAADPTLKVSEAAAAQAAAQRGIAGLPSGHWYKPLGGGWTKK